MRSLLIVTIIASFLVLSTIHQVESIPSASTQDLYDWHDIILLGNVISKNSTFSPTFFSYEIKVEKYLKNPQPDDVITAAGLNNFNPRLGNIVFEVGDRGLFFLNNYTQKYDNNSPLMISLRSMKTSPEWGLCNLFDKEIPRDHWVFGPGDVYPKLSQGNETNTDNFSTDKEILFSYDFLNHTPETKYFEIGVSVIDMDDSTRPSIFRESRIFSLEPCTVYKTMTWSFVPTKAGHYSFDLYDPLGTRFGVGFVVHEESIPSTQNFIGNDLISPAPLSPLKQFKSGIPTSEIKCKEGLQLIFKASNGNPACVKPETKIKLIEQGWASETLLQKTWVEIDPIQCGGNPWEEDWLESHPDDYLVYARIISKEKIDIIANYYKKFGITIFDVRLTPWENVAVCESCSCPVGYTQSLLVSNSKVDKMLEFGYKISEDQR